MVKSIVAASSIEAAFEARGASAATAASVEWGFLVGQAAFRAHDKDYVLATIPAAESENVVSDDLIDQASQAARMCVGGIQLLGLYQYGPDGTGSLERLCKHATAVRDALACEVGEWLILQVAFGARKYTAKSLATLKVHLSTRLSSNAVGTTVTDRLRAAADAQCAAFEQDAVMSIDGECADGAMALAALPRLPSSVDKGSAVDHGCVAHKVEIYAPNLGQPVATTDTTSDDSNAVGELFGAVTVHAVLHEKGTTVADAMAFLWQDLRGSLRSRLSMQGEMLAAAAGDAGDSSNGAGTTTNIGVVVFGKPTPLPRRLLLNTSLAVPGVDCCYTDYLYPEDSYADSAERVADVLGCLQGVHIMPFASANAVEEEGGVPEWVLAEEPTHHATSSSDRRQPESSTPSASDSGLSWLVVGLAGAVAVAALLMVAVTT